MFVSVVALHIPRFALSVAAGGSRDLLAGPVALAPEPGRPSLVGEPSPAALSGGVRGGMAVGEALARVPALKLLPPDPVAVQGQWDGLLRSLEGTGALVEDGGPGTACFESGGLRRLHGGTGGVVEAARRAIGRPARFGIGPNRFCAVAAAGPSDDGDEPEPVRLDVNVDAYVPADYIPYEAAKIDVHRRVAAARDVADLGELRAELEDRFGPVPQPVANLLALQQARI